MVVSCLIACSVPTRARAESIGVNPGTASGDGVYGRFDGDVDLGMGVGLRAAAPGLGPNLRLTSHFMATVGLSVDLTWPVLGDHDWSLGTGIDLKPLFLPRWALNLQQGPAFWDLLLDSLSVSGGPVFQPLNDGRVGFGLEVGLGLPLSSHAHGFWLNVRGASRWVGDAPPLGGLVSLSWQAPWLSPAVD
jgi:hypothetical protein